MEKHACQRALLLLTILAVGAFLLRQVYDPDIWWHVTIGDDILRTRSIPRIDRYALAGLGNPYHDSHWLFQVLLALFHRAAGMVGVQLGGIALWALTLYITYKAIRHWAEPGVAALLMFCVAMASEERFISRPEIITFLMVALFGWLLQEGRHRTWRGKALFALAQCLWANAHGLFVIGPFMVGCYWVADTWKRLRGRPAEPGAGGLTLLTVAASLLTPFGFNGLVYAYTLFTEVGASAPPVLRTIGELRPTFGSGCWQGLAFWFFLLLLILTLIGIAGLLLRNREAISLPRLLIIVGLGLAASTGRRNIPLFALAAGPFIAEQFFWLLRSRPYLSPLGAVAGAIGMLVLAVLPISGRHYAMRMPTFFGFGVTPLSFPTGLPAYLQQIGFTGQILNSGNLGGFYLYHSYPRRIPLYDGRWEVYGPGRLESLQTVMAQARENRPLWRAFTRDNDIRGILIQHISPEASALLPFLPGDPDWRLAYYDNSASFWLRSDVNHAPQVTEFVTAARVRPFASRDDWGMLDWFLMTAQAPLDIRLHHLRQVPVQWRNREMEMAIEEMARKLGQTDK